MRWARFTQTQCFNVQLLASTPLGAAVAVNHKAGQMSLVLNASTNPEPASSFHPEPRSGSKAAETELIQNE